ncbi:MAG TPA: 30S ribosomal protein S4 [Candidatus Enterosoma merdigallinarum]|nr:30S ribosomal protein S4 [Candidatus Enterosoma merdigallinarum]
MSRYTGPVWRISRRLGYSILGSGKELQKRQTVPGQHGDARPKKKTEYGIQMTEKQKLRFTYGISEKQFQRLFRIAKSDRTKVTGTYFMQILESRLDNLVYRLGFAQTRRQARQLVTHGHVTVNGKKVDIPSYLCSINDVISFKESSKSLKVVREAIEKKPLIPAFVESDPNKVEGKFLRLPERSELYADIDEAQVVEFYNRKL